MSKRAWVTLATNDSYGLGALVLAHSLRRAGSVYPAVVLITPSVTQPMRDRLSAVFAEVIVVNVLDSQDAAHLALLQRPELGITFTKIHCWNLSQYEKCVFLDADTLVIQNSDELFEREELSAAPDVGWPDCFNSGVFVISPSPETFEKLIKFAQERGSFDGGDQGLLNTFFSDWAHGDINKHLPFVYNVTSAAFYSYLPALKHYGHNLKIIHFIGAAKPWLQQYNWESGSVDAPEHLREFLQLWWDLFVANVHAQLDISMVEVEEAPPELPELPELPPQDVFRYYEPLVDPQSEFLWHHPKAQDVESNESKTDTTDFFDPWEHYGENIGNNANEIQKDSKLHIGSFFWEHNSQKDDKQFVHYQEPSGKYTPKSGQLEQFYKHNNIDIQYYEQQQQHIHNRHQLQNLNCQFNDVYYQQSNHDYQPVEHNYQLWGHNFQFNIQQHDYNQQSSEPNNNRHQHDQSFEHHHHPHTNNQHHTHSTSDKDHILHSTQLHEYHDDRVKNSLYLEHSHHKNEDNFRSHLKHEQDHLNCNNTCDHHTDFNYNSHHSYSADCSTQHKNQLENHDNELQSHYQDLPNSVCLQNQTKKQPRSLTEVYQVQMDHFVHLNNGHSDKDHSEAKGDPLEELNEYQEVIIPRHPYDGFYLRHRATINPHGRKICLHELVQQYAPPDDCTASEESGETRDQSGVAGNLARVVPGTAGFQREALDELTRRQGWEAGNIDYMGADSFENIWAKISQTLSQPRSSPPKQLPPKEPSPPQKQPSPVKVLSEKSEKDLSESQTEITSTGSEAKQETVSESIEVAQEAVTIDAPVVQKEPVAEKISSAEKEPKVQDIPSPDKTEISPPKEVSISETLPVTEVVSAAEIPVTGDSVEPAETSVLEKIEPAVDAVVSKVETSSKVEEKVIAPSELIPVKDAVTVKTDILATTTNSPSTEQANLTASKESFASIKAPETIAVEASVLLEATELVKATSPVEATSPAEATSPLEASSPVQTTLPVQATSPVEATVKSVVETPVLQEKVAKDSTLVSKVPDSTVGAPVTVPSKVSDSISPQALLPPAGQDIPKTVANVKTEIVAQSQSSVLGKDAEKQKNEPVQKIEKAEKAPPATPKSTPEATTPISESTIKDPLDAAQLAAVSTGTLDSQTVIDTPVVTPASPVSANIPTSTVPATKATPEKPLDVKTSTDSPPLANTPSKEEAPALPVAKSEERRKPVGKLQLSPPVAADPLPTPDSELEDAATLAQSIIASELKTPTVSSPSPSTVPISPMPPKQEKRLSVEEPEVPTPPVGAVSLAQIGVKPSKGKPNTAALIESSVTEKSDPVQSDKNAPVSPTKTSEPSTDVKKKAVKKLAKESSSTEAPVPPPRKKEKKPKEK